MIRKLPQLSAILVAVLLLCASAAFCATSISNIVTTPASPASLLFNEHADITYDYETDEAGGVRIYTRPFTSGSITPNYGGSGSSLYPTGSGSGTGSITVLSGEVVVDSIRFQVWNDGQTVLLLEFFIPVEFHYSTHSIRNIAFIPTTPASLIFNDTIDITFDYETDEAAGVLIFSSPISDGSYTSNFASSGSPVYPVGSGSGDDWFRINSGEVTVDSIRFKMTNLAQTVTYFDFYLPVDFQYSTHAIRNIVLTPTSPDTLDFSAQVDITFDYETDEAGGVRIWARPFTNGSLSPQYGGDGSVLHLTGSGAGTSWITVASGEVIVDSIRFQMWDSSNSTLLLEYFLPVHFGFDTGTPAAPVSNEPTRPQSFTLSQNHPNPFNPSTVIEYTIHEKSHVTITVLNSLGQKVTTLVDGIIDLGPHSVNWEGIDSDGKKVPTGVYFYRFDSDDASETKKMLLVK